MNRKEAIAKIKHNRDRENNLIVRLSARKWPAVKCMELEAEIHKLIYEDVRLRNTFKITDEDLRG